MNERMEASPRRLARIAGVMWLLVIVGGIFAEAMFSTIGEPADAAATADQVRDSAAQIRAGLLSSLLAGVPFVLLAIVLYGLLEHVHRLAAITMVTFNAIGTAIWSLNLLNWYTALTVAGGDPYRGTVGADVLTMLSVDTYHTGVSIAFVFDALWLVPLGYLVIRSAYFPSVLGVALIVGCGLYLTGFVFVDLIVPDATGGVDFVLAALGGLAEAAMAAWLLIRGVRRPVTGARAGRPAVGR